MRKLHFFSRITCVLEENTYANVFLTRINYYAKSKVDKKHNLLNQNRKRGEWGQV